MARFSWGQSLRILFKSRLIAEQMIGHFIFNCQSRRHGQRPAISGQRAVSELFTGHSSLITLSSRVEQSIESFIRYLAVERGLSDNYQLSTQRSLTDFASWCARERKIDNVRAVTLPMLSEYLAAKKKAGLAASSIKLIVVALKIFFRFLAGKGAIERDPTEAVPLPRIERYLPETLNEMQVEKLLNSVDTKVPRGLRDRAMLELLYSSVRR